MGLIKSNNAPSTLAPFSLRDIEAQARAILLRAQQEADQFLAKAHTEGEKVRQRAYDAGFTAGQEDGRRKGAEDGQAAGRQAALLEQRAVLETLVKSLTSVVSEIDLSRQQLESVAATDVVKLSVSIARRVTKLQGMLHPEVLTENLREAMKLVVHASDVRIAVHPSQKSALNELLPQLRMEWPNVTHLELLEDVALAPGGCRVLTAGGEIDADLDRQIDRVAADLIPGGKESPA